MSGRITAATWLLLLAGGVGAQEPDRPSLLTPPWGGYAPNLAVAISARTLSLVDSLGHFDRLDWDGFLDSTSLTRTMSESRRSELGCVQARQLAVAEDIDYVLCGMVLRGREGLQVEAALWDIAGNEASYFTSRPTNSRDTLVEEVLRQIRAWQPPP